MSDYYKPIWWRPWMAGLVLSSLTPADQPAPVDASEPDEVQGYMFLPDAAATLDPTPAEGEALPS
jgi:hypothetical protein